VSKSEENKVANLAIRSLTRGEVKRLREAGADPAFASAVEASPKLVDFVLTEVYGEMGIDWDSVPYNECLRLASGVYKATYGSVEQAKNS